MNQGEDGTAALWLMDAPMRRSSTQSARSTRARAGRSRAPAISTARARHTG